MKKIDDFICKINFRKAVSVYVICSLVVFLILFSVLLFLSKDKIKLASDYEEAGDIYEKYGVVSKLETRLDKLTRDSSDVVNVMILNRNNHVIYKANDNILHGKDSIDFTPYLNNSKYILDNINENNIYKIAHPKDILFNANYFRNRSKLANEIEDDFLYEKYFEYKNIYLVNFMADVHGGDKVILFRDVKPIPYADKIVFTIAAFISLVVILYWIGLALWVYKDSKKANLSSPLWGLFTLITNLVGFIVYIIFKRNYKRCKNCGQIQNKNNIYCVNCGYKINATCEKCGNILNFGDQYCGRCGNKI